MPTHKPGDQLKNREGDCFDIEDSHSTDRVSSARSRAGLDARPNAQQRERVWLENS